MPRLPVPEPNAANLLPVKHINFPSSAADASAGLRRPGCTPLVPPTFAHFAAPSAAAPIALTPSAPSGATEPTGVTALGATASGAATSANTFRRLGDVRHALLASNVGSLILVALIITVRSAQHGLAVLLSVGPDGVDLPGAAYAPMSRDSMQKHVDKQTSAFLGTEMTTFLAF